MDVFMLRFLNSLDQDESQFRGGLVYDKKGSIWFLKEKLLLKLWKIQKSTKKKIKITSFSYDLVISSVDMLCIYLQRVCVCTYVHVLFISSRITLFLVEISKKQGYSRELLSPSPRNSVH